MWIEICYNPVLCVHLGAAGTLKHCSLYKAKVCK